MDPKLLTIYNQSFDFGQKGVVTIPVGKLPLGPKIGVKVFVYRSTKPGPTVLLLGGLHGDEINGVEILRRAQEDGFFDKIAVGTVIVIPLLNAYGFIQFSRDVTDGKDVNRSFPGSNKGSMASRVANAITKHILPNIDAGIDFHTGGGQRYNFPQVRYTTFDSRSETLAKVFGAPILLPQKPIAKSLRRSAKDFKIPLIVYEGGEALRYDDDSINHGTNGILRVLHHFGMISQSPTPTQQETYQKTTWIRANNSGLVETPIKSGIYIRKGQKLCEINDPYGESKTLIISALDGFVIGHNNCPVVVHGDPLFHVAHNAPSLGEEDE